MTRNVQYALSLCVAMYALFFCGLPTVMAQATPTLTITVTSGNPSAGSTVNLEVSSQDMNLSAAQITWYVDGTAVQNGSGMIDFSVQAKNDGSQTTVKAIATAADGTTEQASQIISPASVDLIIEPTGYTPPFYKGDALFVTQGTARVIAIPHVIENGAEVDPSTLIYRWTKDGTIQTGSSGIGNATLTVNGSVPIDDIDVSVSILDAAGNVLTQGATVVSLTDPKIVLYEDSPLYGVLYNQAIGANYYLGNRQELDVTAKPYFFNVTSDAGSDSSYDWSVGGSPTSASGKSNELIMKQTTSNLQGLADISLDVKNVQRIFQYASASFQVTFGI